MCKTIVLYRHKYVYDYFILFNYLTWPRGTNSSQLLSAVISTVDHPRPGLLLLFDVNVTDVDAGHGLSEPDAD
jgi:hypothetical protein